jgi:hypothetical protein
MEQAKCRMTEATFAVVAIVLIVLAGVAPSSLASSNSQPSNCTDSLRQQITSASTGLNITKAIALAEPSPGFMAGVGGYKFKYSSEFNTFSFDKSTCELTKWKGADIVFSLNGSDEFRGYAVVTEDPALTKVLNVTFQWGAIYSSNPPISSQTFSGYEVYEYGYPIVDETAQWDVPTVSQPPTSACSNGCYMTNWIGLTPAEFESTGYNLVQAGTQSNLSCSIYCSYSYSGWYEFTPAAEVHCLFVAPGDSMSTEVYNYLAGGGSQYYYSITVTDNSLGQGCGVSDYYYPYGPPFYAQFFAERPLVGQTIATLPEFNSVSMTGQIVYNTNRVNLYSPYSSQYYYEYYMVNAGSQNTCAGQPLGSNICLSSIDSSGSFSQTWATSSGT